MDTQSREANLDWIPDSGFRLRKAGVQFDAVRVTGDDGHRLVDLMDHMTGGEPGPVVVDVSGRRCAYFLLPPGSTTRRSWPRGALCYNSANGYESYVPVPALRGRTWPLLWRFPPVMADRFVHPVLLRSAVITLLG
ncbi:hypothetical protein OHS70_17090 [Streptomyces sp. NBC_00390]|uniref:hypothetical protein n=1 Tax=Streptomyces sp. NBC_00390 TaxID=2975736 RepID=UPI002E215B23